MSELATQDWNMRKGVARFFAIATACVALPLLISGGSVTSYGVGMAVPDWPTSMGQNMFTFNFWAESFGVQVEHMHRLFGSAVGLLSIATVVSMKWAKVRPSLFRLALIGLVAVSLQGLIGGQRVRLNAIFGRNLALIHGVFGQVTFSLLVSIAMLSGKRWLSGVRLKTEFTDAVRWTSVALGVLLFAQIIFGAILRHLNQGLAVHLTVACAIVIVSFKQLLTIFLNDGLRKILGAYASAFAALLVVQLLLGLGAYLITGDRVVGVSMNLTHWQALVPTLHVVTGASLLGCCTVMTIASFGRLESQTVADAPAAANLSLGVAR